jgi:hypothetical protein
LLLLLPFLPLLPSVRPSAIIGSLALLIIPLSSLAAESTIWDFTDGQVPTGWEGNGDITVQPHKLGLYIQAKSDSFIATRISLSHKSEAVIIRYSTPKTVTVKFGWHSPEIEDDAVFTRLPIILTESAAEPSEISIDLTQYNQWDPHADAFGFVIPAETEIVIHSIEFTGWNALERLSAAWKSFWTFDSINGFSINFLWGPWISTTPVGLEMLFDGLMPHGFPANILFYVSLIIGTLLIAFFFRRNRIQRSIWLLGLFALLWIFYDIRMSSEFLSGVMNDYDTFISQDKEIRTFREREHFFALAEAAREHMEGRPYYLFAASQRYPFLGQIRYYTYPSIPLGPNAPERGQIDTWVFYNRTDIRLNEARELLSEGNVISRPGRVLASFGEGTFIFREDTP